MCYLAASVIIVIIIFVTLLVARLLFSVLSVLSCFCLYCCYIIYCMLPLEVNKVVQWILWQWSPTFLPQAPWHYAFRYERGQCAWNAVDWNVVLHMTVPCVSSLLCYTDYVSVSYRIVSYLFAVSGHITYIKASKHQQGKTTSKVCT